MIAGNATRYKFFWFRNDKDTGGVGIQHKEKRVEHVLEVKRISDRICAIKINVSFTILIMGLDDSVKELF